MSFRLTLAAGIGAVALVAGAVCGASAETYSRTVPSGKSTVIGSFAGYMRHTCASIGLPDIKTRESPANGDLRIEHRRAKPASGFCSDTLQEYLVFVYTPKKGFRGSDRVKLDIPWRSYEHAAPTLLTDTYEIAVQ